MESQRLYQIIYQNLDQLVDVMLTVPKGASVDVYCDPAGKNISVSKPTPVSSMKLCSVSSPDLPQHYDLHPQGDGYVNGDGLEISKDGLRAYLVQNIRDMRDGGAEWGWEFRLPG